MSAGVQRECVWEQVEWLQIYMIYKYACMYTAERQANTAELCIIVRNWNVSYIWIAVI